MPMSEDGSYFLKLFSRGRYVTSPTIAQSEAESDEPQRRHEERQRFAVSAIAFCIKRDSSFRRHFLKVVADSENADICEVDVEPKRWGDLLLRGKDIIVLEFKLQALLAEHQDPNTGRFVSDGYGLEIRKEFGDRRKVLYIVVGKDVPSGRTKNDIPFRGLPWSAFLIKDRKETPIERDLFDCLGVLGAPVFLSRRMKKKAPTKEAIGALEVYQLLERAAGKIRTGAATSGGDHIGLDLSSTGAMPKSQHKILKDVVQPRGRSLGWIGYEPREEFEKQLCLSVWFYSSQRGKKAVRNRLHKLEAEGRGKILEEENNIGFVRPGMAEPDHEKWIADVLQTVTGETN